MHDKLTELVEHRGEILRDIYSVVIRTRQSNPNALGTPLGIHAAALDDHT